jgi:hypothetical protein
MRSSLAIVVLGMGAISCAGESASDLVQVIFDFTPASVNVSPALPVVYVGDSVRFSAEVKNAAGQVIPVRVTWRTSDSALVSIDTSGLAKVLAEPSPGKPTEVRIMASVSNWIGLVRTTVSRRGGAGSLARDERAVRHDANAGLAPGVDAIAVDDTLYWSMTDPVTGATVCRKIGGKSPC